MRTNRPIEIYNTCEVEPGDRAYKSKGLKRSEVAQLEIGTGGVAHTLRARNVKWVIVDEIDNDIV